MKKNMFGKVLDFIGLSEEDELEFEEFEEEEEEIEPYVPINKKGKIVNIQSVNNTNTKVVLVEPINFDEAPQICDNLKNRKTIVVNLEKAEHEEARKIFDFLNGSVYALDGKVQKIANGVFILAPKNVDILSEIGDELKNKSLFNWQNK